MNFLFRFIGIVILASVMGQAYGGKPFFVTVPTHAPNNRNVKVWCRVPTPYDEKREKEYRVLVIFEGRNMSGELLAKGSFGFGAWADKEGVFLVCPGFKDDRYWFPADWSGKALIAALDEVKKKYRVNTEKVLYYGYSAGGQCSNLFAAWKPELTRAWVSYGCGIFHTPTNKMRGVPGLVACGEADGTRYLLGKKFVAEYRKKGVNVIWRTYPNVPHSVPQHAHDLAMAFLGYYHKLYEEELLPGKKAALKPETPLYVGDDQELVYYPVNIARANNIIEEDKVYFPCKEIADAWKKGGNQPKK